MSFFQKIYLFLTIFSFGFVVLKAPIPLLTEFFVDNGLLDPLSAGQKTELEKFKLDEVDVFPREVIRPIYFDIKKEQAHIDKLIDAYIYSNPIVRDGGRIKDSYIKKVQEHLEKEINATQKKLDKNFLLKKLREYLGGCRPEITENLLKIDQDTSLKLLGGNPPMTFTEFRKQIELGGQTCEQIKSIYEAYLHYKVRKSLSELLDDQLESFFTIEEKILDITQYFNFLGAERPLEIKYEIVDIILKHEAFEEFIKGDQCPKISLAEFRQFVLGSLEIGIKTCPGNRSTACSQYINLWTVAYKEKYHGRVRTIAAISILLGIIGFGSNFLFKKIEGNKPKAKRSRRINWLINSLKFGGLATALIAGGFLFLYEYKNRDLLKFWFWLKHGISKDFKLGPFLFNV